MKPPLTDLLRGCRLDAAGTVPRADPGDVGAKETAPQQPERRLAPARFANSVGEYDSNRTPTGPATLCSDDTAVDFSRGSGSPGTGLPNDNFPALWTRTVTLTAATSAFAVGSDGGARLYIDGTIVPDWRNDRGYGSQTVAKTLTAGLHLIVKEFYENGGAARATLSWT